MEVVLQRLDRLSVEESQMAKTQTMEVAMNGTEVTYHDI